MVVPTTGLFDKSLIRSCSVSGTQLKRFLVDFIQSFNTLMLKDMVGEKTKVY